MGYVCGILVTCKAVFQPIPDLRSMGLVRKKKREKSENTVVTDLDCKKKKIGRLSSLGFANTQMEMQCDISVAV